jgi:hypothetical protein
MKEYQDLESLISKYNLTTVAKRTGEIYIALLNFCSQSMHRLPFNQTFDDLNPAELTHLSVCLIADILKIDIYPLYRPQIVAIRINFTPLECLQQNRKEIRTISQEFYSLKKKLEKLSKSKKDYFSSRDEISELQNGLAEISQSAQAYLEDVATIKLTMGSKLDEAKEVLTDKCKNILDGCNVMVLELRTYIDQLKS